MDVFNVLYLSLEFLRNVKMFDFVCISVYFRKVVRNVDVFNYYCEIV